MITTMRMNIVRLVAVLDLILLVFASFGLIPVVSDLIMLPLQRPFMLLQYALAG